jgi:hypothetical protein
MSTSFVENRQVLNTTFAKDSRLPKEVMVFCPACKTFETVCFNRGVLNQTRKFTQYGNHIYHDCGSKEPCRLYMTL